MSQGNEDDGRDPQPSQKAKHLKWADGADQDCGGRDLVMIQWTQGSGVGASGSLQINASSLVPSGTPDQFSGGESSSPSPVNCLGI